MRAYPNALRQMLILAVAGIGIRLLRVVLPRTDRNDRHLNAFNMVMLGIIGTNVRLTPDLEGYLAAKLQETIDYGDEHTSDGELHPFHPSNQ